MKPVSGRLYCSAWRVCVRNRSAKGDDPTIIRHLHDLAALEARATASSEFVALLEQAVAADTRRGGSTAPTKSRDRFAMMLERLSGDHLWAQEYEEFVQNVSFATRSEEISFAAALEATTRLIKMRTPR